MLNFYLHFIFIFLSLSLLSGLTISSKYTNEYEDQDLWRAARREIAREAKQYMRENAAGKNLLLYIEKLNEKYKRKRRKRQELTDSNNMYAIEEGNVVPLQRIEETLTTGSLLGDGSNFSVVPLVIPIPLEPTLKPEIVNNDLDRKANDVNRNNDMASTDKAILGREYLKRFKDISSKSSNIEKKETDDEKHTCEQPAAGDMIKDKFKTTSEMTALSKVLEDVEDLINVESGRRPKEGTLCNVGGYWDSRVAGKKFHIRNSKSSNSYTIKANDLEPKSDEGFMVGTEWNVTVEVPFRQASEIIIIGYTNENKKIALFLGECRICDDSETIAGDWIIGRTSSGCKDQKGSHAFFADVLRKDNVETLRKHHLHELTSERTTVAEDAED